jgi:hypothetical protein
MRRLKPRSLGNLLNDQRNPSARLLQHGARLQQLTTLVQTLLPAPCGQHCRVANLRDRVLALAADTPAWAARLRFHAPRLRRDLEQQATLRIDEIRVLVVPQENRLERARPGRPDLSHKSAELLRDTAQALFDPPLRAALLRLAQHARNRPASPR